MTLRTDDELDAALTTLAAAEGVSKQEVVRRAVLDRLAAIERRARLDVVIDDMLDRWGDVLERLRDA